MYHKSNVCHLFCIIFAVCLEALRSNVMTLIVSIQKRCSFELIIPNPNHNIDMKLRYNDTDMNDLYLYVISFKISQYYKISTGNCKIV